MASTNTPDQAIGRTEQLPPDALAKVIKEAKKEGIFAGLTSGLASAVLGQKFFHFNRNKTFLCGALSAVFAGYLFTQAFTDTAITQLHAEEKRLAASANSGSTRPGNIPSSSA